MHQAVAIFLSLIFCHAVCLAEGKVTKGAAPGWVVQHASPFPDATEDEDGAERYLLVDVQRHAEQKATYEAFAIRVLSAAGVEDHSQLSVDFQPTYQNLVWHHLDVIRGGEKQDRLATAEFEMIRREEGLENRLYDGQITAHVILKDIRPGDIISYSFTTQGENPILAGHIHGSWSMGYSMPVGRLRRAVIWDPKVRTMAWRLDGLDDKAQEEELEGGIRRFSYERNNPDIITAEKNTPQWFDDFPYLEFSDYRSWEDFGKWTDGIYSAAETLPPELKQVCDGIRKEGGTAQEQALKALRWSQSNIRYLGSFFGEHTHAPYPLDEIISRRFGDCKDKGMLTVAMLRELGHDAAPALVGTNLDPALANRLPGHACFNHLIVHLRLGAKDYWLDPTRTFQRGSLDGLFSPDYKYAFVIRPGSKELTSVKPSGFAEAGIDIREIIDITDDLGNGTFAVHTVFSGVNADSLRRSLAEDGRGELEKDYRDHYAKDYPGIEIAAPLEVSDEETTNQITMLESYRIKGFFSDPETPGGEAGGSVYARDIGGFITIPEAKDRKHPYDISHPVRRSQTIELTIANNWDLEAEEFSASLAAMDYRYSAVPKGRTLVMRHDYQSKADQVAPDEFTAYTKAMKEADDRLYFAFNYPLETEVTKSEEIAVVDEHQFMKSRVLLGACLLVGLFIGSVAAIALYFWDPPARTSTMPNPRSIGGWLILPAIGCFLAPCYSIYIGGTYFNNIGKEGMSLFNGAEDQGLWQIYYGICVLMEGILFPLAALQLVLLLKKRTSFPFIFASFLVLNFGTLLLSLALESTVNQAEMSGAIVSDLLRMLIWGSYMFVSMRVRATFVHRRKKPPLLQPPPLPQHMPG